MLLYILCFIIIATIVIPNLLKIKNIYWFIIQLSIVITCLVFIMLLPEILIDSFLFVGGALGIGLLLKGITIKNDFKYLLFVFSFSALSVILIAANQVYLFVINVSFSFILFISITFCFLNKTENKTSKIKGNLLTLILNLILVVVFSATFSLLISTIFPIQRVDVNEVSILGLFLYSTENLTLLLIIIAAVVVTIILISVDLISQSKQREDERWFT